MDRKKFSDYLGIKKPNKVQGPMTLYQIVAATLIVDFSSTS